MMERRTFHAMGTTVECLVDASGAAARAALATVEREFERLERLLSRFRPDSELSRLNRAGVATAGPELFEVVELAVGARERTEGRFDPTVHDALVAAGYDRSFELLDDDRVARGGTPRAARGHVSLDRTSRRIELAPGARLDLGGIAKGWAVDRVCTALSEHGACLVNAGGDLTVRGLWRGGPWPVGLETPDGERVLGLSSGALATSGSDRRRWSQLGIRRHHLIDPATGSPSASDLLRLTLVAATATEAEVWTKALFMSGAQRALAEAEARGLQCLAVTADGSTLATAGLS